MSFFSFPHFALLLRLGFLALCYPITRKGVQSERYCEVNSYYCLQAASRYSCSSSTMRYSHSHRRDRHSHSHCYSSDRQHGALKSSTFPWGRSRRGRSKNRRADAHVHALYYFLSFHFFILYICYSSSISISPLKASREP